MTQSNPHAQFGCGKTVVPARTEAPWKLRRRYEGLGAHLPFLSKLAKSRGEKAELLLSRAHGTVFRIIKKLNDDLLNLRLVPKNLPRLRKKLSQYEDLMRNLQEEKSVRRIRKIQFGGFLNVLLSTLLPLVMSERERERERE